MFTETDVFSDPRPAVIPVSGMVIAAQQGGGQPKVEGAVSGTTKAEWTDEIHAICTRQDQAAFARLFRHFAPRVKSFLMKSGLTPEAAEECMQEAMATVWHKAGLFDGGKASPSTWIFTIARNRKIDMIRKSRRPEPEDLPWGPEAEPEQSDAMVVAEETDRLGRAIADLPEKQRDLIVRAYYGDLTHREIAEATGLPLGTIKSRIRLALDRLRHAMDG